MAANKKYNRKIDSNNLNEWLRSTGFLFPKNEIELARFNELYADFDFKLNDAVIDVKSIIEGTVCSVARVVRLIKNDDLNNDIEELKMVARKGEEVPKHIIDKMKQKHRKKNNDEEK